MARLMLRNGVAYAEFAEYARRAFVDSAMEQCRAEKRKPTQSRVAVVTGLTRKEVKRIMETEPDTDEETGRQHNRAARVVAAWLRDPDFTADDHEPAVLPFEAASGPSFTELVRRHSGDMPPRAVFDELARVHVVDEPEPGQVRLRQRVYRPAGDDAQQLHIFGTDVADLVATIDHNLSCSEEQKRFQRTLRYQEVPVDALPAWRAAITEHSQALLEAMDRRLASSDAMAESSSRDSGRARAGLGIFYFEEPLDDDAPSQERETT